jgi:hypothetical protein
MEPMTVKTEVWPVTADDDTLWLLGSDAWRASLPVAADGDVHAEVELTLAEHGIRQPDGLTLLHSPSWRPQGTSVMLTYVAVVPVVGMVLDRWPGAQPIQRELLTAVGRPRPHGATDVPLPRWIDVLVHAIRHLEFLRRTNAEAAQALTGPWVRHLRGLRPALAGLYAPAWRDVLAPDAEDVAATIAAALADMPEAVVQAATRAAIGEMYATGRRDAA